MPKELAVAAGLVVLAFLLMAFARNLYPTIPSVPESITLEERITTTTTTTTTRPSGTATTTTAATEAGHEETTTITHRENTTTGTEHETTTTTPRGGQELEISFYNSIVAMIDLEENEEEFEGLVKEAYVAGVQRTCSNCVGVLVVDVDGREVAVVLINTWSLENGEERRVEAVDLARLLLGRRAEFYVVRIGYEINGLEAYAAIEISWEHGYAELLGSRSSGEWSER